MKTLILYASAGSGHKKAAEAIYSQLKSKYPNDKIEFLDILDFGRCVLKFAYRYVYEFLIGRFRIGWAILFFLTNQRALHFFNKTIRFYIERSNLNRLSKYIIKSNPELIISTHFLSSELVIYLKQKDKIKSKIVSVITDFGVHYVWAKKGADKYIVATERTKQELADFGIKKSKIEILGIPVREDFFKELDRKFLQDKLGVGEGLRVLVMTGGFGVGPIEEIVEALYKEMNLIVICGKNKRLFDNLNKKNYPSVKVLGFVDNVDEWMSVSNILITKAGGLTISEAIARMLPMIFFFLVPGQEKNNARVMQDLGAGKIATDIKEIKNLILDFKSSPEKLEQMKKNLQKIKQSRSTNFIERITDAG